MAVLDVPELMNMFRQDEQQKQAVAEAQRRQAMEERAMAIKEQPDVDFSFEKGGLKVKGKLKDLPALSQDPAFAPYLSGIGSTISNEQSLQNEEIEGKRSELNDRLKKLAQDKMKQEIEMAKGDTRTFAMEAGMGLIGAKPRTDVMRNIEAEAGVYRNKLAELSLNRQTGQMDALPQEDVSAPVPQEQPAVQQPAQTAPSVRNFKTAQEARAAGVKPGELIYINGKPGRLQPKQ
jgi:hypothetical protein